MSRSQSRTYGQAVRIQQGQAAVVTDPSCHCFAVGAEVVFDQFDSEDGTYGFYGASRDDGHFCRQWLYPGQFATGEPLEG